MVIRKSEMFCRKLLHGGFVAMSCIRVTSLYNELVIAFIDVVAPKGAVCSVRDVIHFMLALHGFGGLAECPWA